MKLTIYGSGYVGLVTGACFADVGNQVVCVDIDNNKVEALKQGKIPIHEPGLSALIQKNLSAGRIEFTTDAAFGVAHAKLQIIAVGTPPDEDGSADLTHVLDVARTIGGHMTDAKLIVNKSTVPVGTADRVRQAALSALQKRQLTLQLDVASNPEFLKEGDALADFTKPDRIVVGAESEDAIEVLKSLYGPFNRSHDRLLIMSIRSAELCKYAANAMLATKISFMNELANISERLGADIEQVRIGIGADPRIGYHFIYPGCGFGGSCFPKDLDALSATAKKNQYHAELIDAVIAVNLRQKQVLFTKIRRYFSDNLKGKQIAIWGLAFKPQTDDMREASSRTLIDALLAAGAHVRAYDPVAMQEAQRIYANQASLTFHPSALDAVKGADAVAIVTEWSEFRSPDFVQLKSLLKTPVIFDGRNLYTPAVLKNLGFEYFAIGRGIM